MAKRIIVKLHSERYIVQDNMLFGCIPFIYVARKVFDNIDEAREYVGEPCDEYLFVYKLLFDLGIQHKVAGQWVLYRQYLDKGYVNSEPVSITHSDGT